MPTHESKLDADLELAFREGDMFFDERSGAFETLKRVARRLDELGIDYAVVGGMALFAHGYRRYTEDVDILVTPEGLAEAHRQMEGLGYVPPFAGSKQLRDVENDKRIEFLVTGQYPGDGKPKPVAFPDPKNVAVVINGIRFLKLEALIELKLASGMTSPMRPTDIGDVIALIRILKLGEEFDQKLAPYVREKFKELRTVVANNPETPT